MQLFGLFVLCMGVGDASAQSAPPAPVVVWLDRDAPDERAVARAEKLVGGTAQHYGAAELAFPPQPWTPKDATLLGEIGKTLREAQREWEGFDVERGLARDLRLAVDGVTVLRDTAERDTVVLGLLWQGAAVNLAFSPEELANHPDAQAFRLALPGATANRPFVEMIALDPARRYGRGEMPEGASYGVIQELTELLADLPSATLNVGPLPPQATLFLNGQPVPLEGAQSLSLLPGHYWAHLLVNNVICGRVELDLVPGATVDLPRAVSEGHRAEAERLVEVETLQGLPPSVGSAVGLLGAQHPGAAVYVAAVAPDGQVVVLPYSGGARVVEKKPLTFAFGAELGGGVISSSYLYYGDPETLPGPGEVLTVPGGSAALDLELGLYNLALLGGGEVWVAPTAAFVYGTGDPDATPADNLSTQLAAHLRGGVGVYALRPSHERKPTLLFGATYGWFSPGFAGPGGRITFGIPIDRRNWFKLTAHGVYAMPLNGYPEDGPLVAAGLRLGFQTAL